MSSESGTGKSKSKRQSRGLTAGRILLFVVLLAVVSAPGMVYFFGGGEVGKMKPEDSAMVEAVSEVEKEQEGTADPVVVEKIVERVVEKIIRVPVEAEPEPMPSKFVAYKKIDTAQLYNGIEIRSELQTEEGRSASVEREDPSSYVIELAIKIKVPKANQSLQELTGLNEHLPKMLPGLGAMVESGKVSPFYYHLYDLKQQRVQHYLTRLNRVLSRHHFFDCETILELQHPETQQKVLLMQGEMDVVSDGSDGDRWPKLDEYISMSANYQPFTSYGWAKKTKTPNPLLAGRVAKLKKYETEFKIKGLSIERNRFLKSNIDLLKREIADLKGRSFLIAEADPFIVIPLSMVGKTKENAFAPSFGDYAAVVYQDKIYPAIVGDAGPAFQMGEASLRIAKQLNPKSNPYSRPVSDLKVTYLLFPGSKEEKKDAPDLKKWHQRCSDLLGRMGGLGEGYQLHQWEDLIARKRAAAAPPVSKPPVEPPAPSPPAKATPKPEATPAPAAEKKVPADSKEKP
ncbi:MAG: glycoside hydrolase family 75 protein [Verrucomicrobiota bacterium]